jgi:choline dehydrogenase-like flavoprotein
LLSLNSLISYGLSRSGPLAYLDFSICTANSSLNNDTQWPDIQILGYPFAPQFDPTGIITNNFLGLRFDVFEKMYLKYFDPFNSTFMLLSAVTRPKSRGTLQLKSDNPFVDPLLQPNYLSNTYDRQVLVDGLKWIYRISQTNAYKNYASSLPSLVSGCEDMYSEVNDDLYPSMIVPSNDYLLCQATHMTVAGLHMVGTCKMGVISDSMAVVDNMLRVYGVSGLRVIDASIMPVITDANTNAATIMIAERGSAFVKQFYNI